MQTLNAICEGDSQAQETAACIGLIGAALKYLGEEFCKELRIESAFLVGQLFQSSDYIVKLMLAAGGIESIVRLLDLNYEENKELVVMGIDCLIVLIEEPSYMRV